LDKLEELVMSVYELLIECHGYTVNHIVKLFHVIYIHELWIMLAVCFIIYIMTLFK